jgi:hypothetical protein
MATINRRLDQAENALAPLQAVIAWLEQIQTFESAEEYSKWKLETDIESEFNSLYIVVRQSINWAQEQSKGCEPKKVKQVILRAVRDASFLYFLCDRAISYCFSEFQLVHHIFLSSEPLLVFERAARDSEESENLELCLMYAARFYLTIETIKSAIKYLEKKYLGGHPILLKFQASYLVLCDRALEFLHPITQRIMETMEGVGKKGAEELERSPTPKEPSNRYDPIELAEDLICQARINALELSGQPEKARALRTHYYRSKLFKPLRNKESNLFH